MADSLYLSIWFPSFREGEMMPRAVSVLRQFPFSAVREGIPYLSVHPVAWSEPTVLERRFTPGIPIGGRGITLLAMCRLGMCPFFNLLVSSQNSQIT